MDQDALGARLGPSQQLHLGERNAERFREKAAQGPVGLAVHGRRLDPHPKLIPLGLHELVAAPPGLDPQTELEVIPQPAIPIGACLQCPGSERASGEGLQWRHQEHLQQHQPDHHRHRGQIDASDRRNQPLDRAQEGIRQPL